MKDITPKMILVFLVGLLIGAAIVWFFFCGCCKKKCDQNSQSEERSSIMPVPASIDTITANTYFNNYLHFPEGVDTIKGFSVNLAQYNAMRLILDADSTVGGFRIYMGATDTTSTSRISMVVGFGTPDHTETIYATDYAGSGACPFICDETSPIIQPK